MKFIYHISCFLLLVNSIGASAQTTYTWNRTSGGSWVTSGNWTPSRSSPATTDLLVISNGATQTITNVPAATIGRLTISGNSNVTLTATAANTLTIGNGTGTDLTVAGGSTLTLSTNTNVTLAASATADISGTLGINSGSTYNTNGASSVTTVAGTLQNSGTVTNATSGNLIFSNASNYVHAMDWGTIPTATWNTGSTCKITGVVSGTSFAGGVNQTFSNFTWDCPSQTGTFSLAANGGTMDIDGTLTVNRTGTGALATGVSFQPSLTVGNYAQTGGTVYICNNASGQTRTLTVEGSFTLNQSTTTSAFYVSYSNGNGILNLKGSLTITAGTLTQSGTSSNVNFSGTTTQTYSKTGGTISNAVNFTINSGATVDLGTSVLDGSSGTFTMASGGSIITAHASGLSTTAATGSIQVTGTKTYNTGNYTYNGSSAQVIGNGPSTVTSMTINNAAGVSLSTTVTVTETLTLSAGSLTVSGTLIFLNGSTYNHAIDGGTIPTATWNTGSTCKITGVVSGTSFAGGVNQTFSNFTWDCPSQTGTFSLAANGGTMDIDGTLTVNRTGTGALATGVSFQPSLTVGNYAQTGGTVYICNNASGQTRTLTVEGSFTLNQSTTTSAFYVSYSNGNGILNLKGSLTITAGTLTQSGTSSNVNFSGTTTQTYSKTGGTISNAVNFTINSGATVDLGTSVLDGSSGTFTMASGGSIITAHASGLSTTAATGSIQVTGTKTYNTGNYTYNGSSAQVTGNGPSIATTLTINNAAGVSLSSGLTVNTTLSVLSGTFTLNNTLDVSAGGLVSVAGGSISSGGYLTLKCNAAATANVGPLLNGASITGNVNVESYYTGGVSSYRGTRALSSPINESGLSTKIYAQLKSNMIITGPGGTANGFDAGGTASPEAITLTKYYEPATLAQSQFTPVASITESFLPGYGVFLFYRGNRDNYSGKLNAPFATPENNVVTYTGPINSGEISVNLSFTNNAGESAYNGYNLIGNPYPAIINWDNVTKNNVTSELKIVKPGGGFASYLVVDGVGISTNTTGDLRYIMPGQGFYARAQTTGASVTFTENSKSVSSSPVRLLSAPVTSPMLGNSLISNAVPQVFKKTSFKLLRLKMQNAKNTEEAVVVFKAGKSSEALNDDALFMGGTSISLSTLSSDNQKLAINLMPDIAEVSELKLSVSAASDDAVKLTFTDLSMADNFDVFLVDKYLNDTIPLQTSSEYDFAINKKDTSTFGNNRLKLLFKPIERVVVPLTRIELEAKKIAKGVALEWATTSDGNTCRFEIEWSDDNVNFSLLAKVNGDSTNVNSRYSFLHQNPLSGDNYYRIKQINSDGGSLYSETAILDYPALEEYKVSIYPNPATDIINISTSNRTSAFSVIIYDLQGTELFRRTYSKGQKIQENVSALTNGLYIIHIIDVNNNIISKDRFIKR